MLTRQFVGALGIAVAFGFPAHAASAADLTIAAVHRSSTNPRLLYVRMSRPLPARNLVATEKVWSASVADKGGSLKPAMVTSAVPADRYETNQRITLTLAGDLPSADATDYILVVLDIPSSRAIGTWTPADTSAPPSLEPVDDPDDADLYFNGIVAPAKGSGTTYTIDAKASYIFARRGKSEETSWTVNGAAASDHRPLADPDSFRAAVSVEHVPARLPAVFHWDVGAYEFDRNGHVANLLTAPRLVFVWSGAAAATNPGSAKAPTIRYSYGLDLTLGAEGGGNLKNDAAPGAKRVIIRGAPGATAYITIPTSVLKKLVGSLEYKVRFPFTREVFLETRQLPDNADPVASLSRRPRHHLRAQADFMATDWVGFQLKYEWGTLPPAFKFVDHSASIGLVFKARQNPHR